MNIIEVYYCNPITLKFTNAKLLVYHNPLFLPKQKERFRENFNLDQTLRVEQYLTKTRKIDAKELERDVARKPKDPNCIVLCVTRQIEIWFGL